MTVGDLLASAVVGLILTAIALTWFAAGPASAGVVAAIALLFVGVLIVESWR